MCYSSVNFDYLDMLLILTILICVLQCWVKCQRMQFQSTGPQFRISRVQNKTLKVQVIRFCVYVCVRVCVHFAKRKPLSSTSVK